ncbi:MAG: chemotaxis protein CheC [Gammaproteobacteria bacterium]
MSNVPMLSDLEHDLLTELFNIGVGRAADSLSRIVDQEVKMSVPHVEFQQSQDFVEAIGANKLLISISQEMHGPFDAQSLLIFPEEDGINVVKRMLGEDMPDEVVDELKDESFSEIGNIVLNACIGSMANAMKVKFDVGLPYFLINSAGELLTFNNADEKDIMLLIRINMTLSESAISGYLAFILGPLSLDLLQQQLSLMLENLSLA